MAKGFWTLEGRHSSVTEVWQQVYCFEKTEVFHTDFESTNIAYLSMGGLSRFCRKVECLRMLFDVQSDGDITGFVKLSGGRLWTDLGRRGSFEGVLLKDCKNEEARRVLILKGFFGISLSEQEKNGIRGLETELKKRV